VQPLVIAPWILSADFRRLADEARAVDLDDFAAAIARLHSHARPRREA
jgi:hypothetical protein